MQQQLKHELDDKNTHKYVAYAYSSILLLFDGRLQKMLLSSKLRFESKAHNAVSVEQTVTFWIVIVVLDASCNTAWHRLQKLHVKYCAWKRCTKRHWWPGWAVESYNAPPDFIAVIWWGEGKRKGEERRRMERKWEGIRLRCKEWMEKEVRWKRTDTETER